MKYIKNLIIRLLKIITILIFILGGDNIFSLNERNSCIAEIFGNDIVISGDEDSVLLIFKDVKVVNCSI